MIGREADAPECSDEPKPEAFRKEGHHKSRQATAAGAGIEGDLLEVQSKPKR